MSQQSTPLSSLDRFMWHVTKAAHEANYGGFGHQLQLEFRGRASIPILQRALDRLGALHPVCCARLRQRSGWPEWQHRSEGRPELHIVESSRSVVELSQGIDAPQNSTLQAFAIEQLSRPFDFAAEDPVRFHLFRDTSGNDTLLVGFDHTLMDIQGMRLLVAELNRLSADNADLVVPWSPHESEPLVGVNATWKQRLGYWSRFLRERVQNRCLPLASLTQSPPAITSTSAPQALFRTLSVSDTERLFQRIRGTPGLPSLSLQLLAIVTCVIDRHTASTGPALRRVACNIGIPLRSRRSKGPIFTNLASSVRIVTRVDASSRREPMALEISQQLRRRIKWGDDRVHLAGLRHFRGGPLFRRIFRRSLVESVSLRYGYLGELVPCPTFCGAELQTVRPLVEPWPVQGFSILFHEHRGALSCSLTYLPQVLESQRAQAFLDDIVQELQE